MQQKLNKKLSFPSFLDGINFSYIEDLYRNYQKKPSSVCEDWHPLFLFFDENSENWDQLEEVMASFSLQEKTVNSILSETNESDSGHVLSQNSMQSLKDFFQVIKMIDAYRCYGHFAANFDPLGLNPHSLELPELSPSYYGFSKSDYNRKISMQGVLGFKEATVREIIDIISHLYCSHIGVEFMHIINLKEREWVRNTIEKHDESSDFSSEDKKNILESLVRAEGFEKFIDIKHKGAKRFGIDGSEVIIPAIEEIVRQAVNTGIKEVFFGMAHRGRLNVLSQVMKKPARAIFNEFNGGVSADLGFSGDVKYHLGACLNHQISGKNIKLSLSSNPSHLEFVDPVVMGNVRARQDIIGADLSEEDSLSLSNRSHSLAVLIHGDAAVAGQGVVSESLELSALSGYTVAGSIHIILNNQIGFTTNSSSARSSHYPSDVAKKIGIPIFHVNGDDPESVIRVVKIAIRFRMKFHKSVVVDICCYRRFGHNEGDEPSFTQPKMYQKIRSHPSVLQIYARSLIQEDVISEQELQSLTDQWREYLESEFQEAKSYLPKQVDVSRNRLLNTSQIEHNKSQSHNTSISHDLLKDIGLKISCLPKSFKAHKIIERLMSHRRKMIETGEGIDWAMAEALAFASLCHEGYKVRLSGQDCERGTFSQRHAVVYDQETESRYCPLSHLSANQGQCEIINSLLSEQAVLGFEYGYSLENHHSLTLWEAQFGDFANGAQVILDQFISSGEQKWVRSSHLVCLLPHGYEGQGPEHSSARLERFLQMCAEDNMRIANCTSPANYFHILRGQIYSDYAKPLIIMTPKSLLRHKRVVSSLVEMSNGSTFHPVLLDEGDRTQGNASQLVKDSLICRVILCTGKVYYDLLESRDKRNISDIYLLRIEQLYPFPDDEIVKVLSRFIKADMIWCQEEPKNMGAWAFVEPHLEKVLYAIGASCSRFRYVGRPESASTATGTMSQHLLQLSSLIDGALNKD
ncbi:MAG: 2-oxoglutarate dehydrogenase E1 component [Candidatus Liberibacter ctenarytainae]|uniref:2-oxoglutarate dehydrogenase E1 component n=1 Tax=Candidatus Liberibacter ctenarytainae TaxID=2020335 RepID=A0A937DM82_9HYPH|nr:2-oxoglutarate dehydrogenase E1 component [Candidatus Liberibacter ctenarytainae]